MINIIAAVSENGVIGKNSEIPWYIPEDFKYFKAVTLGHVVIMGRRTFESIITRLSKPLPGRTNVVVTKNVDYSVPSGVVVFHDISAAVKAYVERDVYVIGGSTIYEQTIDMADRLFITKVKGHIDGDAFFPPIEERKWKLKSMDDHGEYAFCIYERAVGR